MDIQLIEISAFPGYENIHRKIAIVGKNEDYVNSTVTLLCEVRHYDPDGNRLLNMKGFESETILLVASDASKVDPETGALVFPDPKGNYPTGSMGQYSWLKMAVEAGANPFAITAGAVMEADKLKRFS